MNYATQPLDSKLIPLQTIKFPSLHHFPCSPCHLGAYDHTPHDPKKQIGEEKKKDKISSCKQIGGRKKKDKISSCKQIGGRKKKDKISSCKQIGEGKKRTRFLLVNKLGKKKKGQDFFL
jgi:hypothetical protein